MSIRKKHPFLSSTFIHYGFGHTFLFQVSSFLARVVPAPVASPDKYLLRPAPVAHPRARPTTAWSPGPNIESVGNVMWRSDMRPSRPASRLPRFAYFLPRPTPSSAQGVEIAFRNVRLRGIDRFQTSLSNTLQITHTNFTRDLRKNSLCGSWKKNALFYANSEWRKIYFHVCQLDRVTVLQSPRSLSPNLLFCFLWDYLSKILTLIFFPSLPFTKSVFFGISLGKIS